MRRNPTLLPLLLLAVVLLAGCSSARAAARDDAGAPAPAAAVERFLQLANEGDYVAMGWVFGTERGPLATQRSRRETEQWMYTLSEVLRHESFSIRDERSVPGRSGNAVRMVVELRKQRDYAVPFVAVRGSDGRWYVEQFEIERVLGGR